MNLEEMRARRKELVEKARNLRALANQENRELSEEENHQFEDWLARSEHLTDEIRQESRLTSLEEDTQQPHRQSIRPDVGPEEQRRAAGQPTRFRGLGEQLIAVRRATIYPSQIDPRLAAMRDAEMRAATGLNEGVGSEGGDLIQNDFVAGLLEPAYAGSQVASLVNRDQITRGNGTKIYGVDETSRADGSRWGGIRAYWAAEAGDKTPSKPAFKIIDLNLKKLIGLCYATDEMLEDAVLLEGVIRRGFAAEFGFKLDDACVNGLGAGQPLGILVSPARVSVSKESGQAAATIVPENIVNMWARLHVASARNAVWFINQDTLPQLFMMAMQVGLGGVPVWMPPGGLSAAPYGTLFGRPVRAIEQAATLGTEGDIILADMSQYEMIDKGGTQTATSIHVRFLQDETVFRFVYRVDGQPMWTSALTPYKGGGNTQSPFITLAVRA